jgi:hypothetical protein
MRYLELVYGDKRFSKESQINEILSKNKFYWLIDSEIEDAVIEIKKDTLIWHKGSYYSGNWFYGIFKGGVFYGVWQNGIFENGDFRGRWIDGIKL